MGKLEFTIDRVKEIPFLLEICFILAISFSLRILYLGNAPLWKTELYQSWAAKNFLQGYGFILPSGEMYFRALLTNTLPTVLSFLILGFNEFAARLPSVLLGTASIILVYILGEELLDAKYGLISSLLLGLSYWSITWSTQARMYIHLQFLYILSLFLLLKWSKENFEIKSKYLMVLIAISVLGIHTHILFSSFFITAIIWLSILLLNDYKLGQLNSKPAVMKIRIIASLAIAAVTYLAIYGIPLWFLGYTPEWYTRSRGMLYYTIWLFEYLPFVFLLVSGTILAYINRKIWLIAVSFLAPFILQSILFEFKEPRFIFHLYASALLISALPLYYLQEYLSNIKGIPRKTSLYLIFIFVIILQSPFSTLNNMSQNSHGMIGEQPNHRGPSNYIMEHRDENDIIVSTEPIKTQWYLNDRYNVNYDINHINAVNKSEKIVDSETGLEIINSPEQFQNLINKGNVILISSEKNFESRVDLEIKEVIQENEYNSIEDETWVDTKILEFKNNSEP